MFLRNKVVTQKQQLFAHLQKSSYLCSGKQVVIPSAIAMAHQHIINSICYYFALKEKVPEKLFL